MNRSTSNDVTVVLPCLDTYVYPDIAAKSDDTIPNDALDLLAELWGKALSGTVDLDRGQWGRLQRVLLATHDLWLEAQW